MSWAEIAKKYPEANFLQLPQYGRMNELIGAKVITEDFDGKAHAQMIVRKARRGKYIEIPCGPLLDWGDEELERKVFRRLAEIGRKEKAAFIRIRPQLKATKQNVHRLEKLGLRRAPMHLAAEHTVMIDLTPSEEELLANMRRQTRYEVRRADKLGIKVETGRSEEIFREFHKAQLKTAKRQGFVPPSLEVLLAEREAFLDNITMYVAKTGASGADGAKNDKQAPDETAGLPIAYGMVIGGGPEADYYEAASTDLNRKLPGAYALLWKAICDAKAAGYERFNLWGIAPAGQPNHRYAGVTTFKTGFGGRIVEYVPAYDLVLSRLGYAKDYIIEAARKKKRHL